MEDNNLEIEKNAELDPFAQNAKSSVEIKLTTRGPTMKIKVVTGEEKLLDGLTDAALSAYKKVQTDLNLTTEVKHGKPIGSC